MVNMGAISYLIGGGSFLVLTILLATSWRGRLQGALLGGASFITFLWCIAMAWAALSQPIAPFRFLAAVEAVRDINWIVFLLHLLETSFRGTAVRRARYLVHGLWICLLVLILLPNFELAGVPGGAMGFRAMAMLVLALVSLVLIEQLYRNNSPEQRWAIKHLCLGVGVIFAYDIFMYANALLFLKIDPDLWTARGLVNALAVPLIAVSAARNPKWSVAVAVSRRFVFFGTTLVGAGTFMLAVTAGGYYIRSFGGDWGTIAQIVLVVAAVLLVMTAVLSGQFRTRLKIFLSKNFYSFKYDYRDEWLRFIRTLAEGEPGPATQQRIIVALAQIVDATEGSLWVKGEDGSYSFAAVWNMDAPPTELLRGDHPIAALLQGRRGVVDLYDPAQRPATTDPDVPSLSPAAGAWLLIPLRHHEEVIGFVSVGRPRAPREINWEDVDLLQTAGQQAAGYLALYQASEALFHARQFEAFNRLSAYVVHDLKNMTAQLDLVVSNAKRHLNNPQFVEDAIGTVDNAVKRMNRLLAQLRKARFESPVSVPARLDHCLRQVVARRAGQRPVPALEMPADSAVVVFADPERLAAVIEHIVQNAQEACREDGEVRVVFDREGAFARIRIVDNGVGMDTDFIRTRLFRPFDTTKGNAGMGIGVYETREFVLTLGGRLNVESTPGRGTTFTILLPIASVSAQDADNLSRAAG
jgi:putative PEP-CTERM system histidine kinase